MQKSQILRILKRTNALLEGHFELRSGLHSNRFFQCANILMNPILAGKLCNALALKIKKGIKDFEADAVISPAMGGIIIGHEVAKTLKLPCIFAEKSDGKLLMHRFKIQRGKRYVIAEDVVTRGGRVQEVIDLVRKAGGRIAAIGVLVNRSGGKAKFRYPLFSLLDMEPVAYNPDTCPLCKKGVKLVHPGSK